MTTVAPLLEAFFSDRLARQRQASPNTVAAYRDGLCLLLRFVNDRTGKPPSKLDFTDFDAPTIGAFLEHLELERGNSVATRNSRLAALRSFFSYAALSCPEHAGLIQRVLAIPQKRTDRAIVCYLTHAEVDALLTSPDRSTWIGRRDHALLVLAAQTGLRVSELTRLRIQDAHLGAGAHVWCHGKGRKDRCTPLTAMTVSVLAAWMRERRGEPDDALFPSRAPGHGPLSRDSVEYLVHKHAIATHERCPSLRSKTVTPHRECVIRAQWPFCNRASTWRPSPYGSVTRASNRRIRTFTPTWPRRNAPSPGPLHRPPNQAATSPPTSFSPSSTAYNYAELNVPITPRSHGVLLGCGITLRAASSGLCRTRHNPLITNDTGMTGAEVLGAYHYQPNLERRNHLLKGPQEVAPVYLETAHRIEALLLCHFLAMLTEALLEREIRTSMKAQGLAGIPLYPELRNCPAPSAPRILEIFDDLARHQLINPDDDVVQTFQPQLSDLQQQVLDLLHIPASIYNEIEVA